MPTVPLNGDVLLRDPTLSINNTFDIDAMMKTLEQFAVRNFRSLYHVQRTKVGVETFVLHFNDFRLERRKYGQVYMKTYPKRYVAYVRHTFVPTAQRYAYRRSEIYNKEIDQKTISEYPLIFPLNFLIFVDGEFLSTCEILPLEDKLGIIIDVATKNHPHGISQKTFKRYEAENSEVIVHLIPNYTIATVNTTIATISKFNGAIPLKNITTLKDTSFGTSTLIFSNTGPDVATARLDPLSYVDYDRSVFDMTEASWDETVKSVRFTIIDFGESLIDIQAINGTDPFFRENTKMPCCTENMIVMVESNSGYYTTTSNLSIKHFYPNIYQINGLDDTNQAIVLVFYSDYWITENEEYRDDLTAYKRYIDLFEEHRTGTIPELIKDYMPEPYTYSIEDYNGSVYLPCTMNYKIGKLRETIAQYPDILRDYMSNLKMPMEKYYVKMSKLDLDSRLRIDTYDDDVDEGSDTEFSEPHYVFTMNRHFLRNSEYAFRLFLDGYFMKKSEYTLIAGLDFYYIYIPASRIIKNSILEIEKYRLFNYFTNGSVTGNEDYIELLIDESDQIIPANDIFAYDPDTLEYCPKTCMELYCFNEYANQWVKLLERDGAYNIAGKHVAIHVIDEKWQNRYLTIGVYQAEAMITGKVFNEDDINPMLANIPYTRVMIHNFGQYTKESYRVFNNGRFCVPISYYVKSATKYGYVDEIRTKGTVHTGDQFTVDRVPGNYRLVLYKREIDEIGYVDLDGRIPLPISLKYYDIYLNGLRLNTSHIDIISPTKFYIKNIKSRQNLVIMERNHDDDVFYLTSFAYKKPGYNDTIMDKIMGQLRNVKDTIDKFYSVIENEEIDSLDGGVMSDAALVQVTIFEEILKYCFINANHPNHRLQEIKRLYPETLTQCAGKNVYHVTGNLRPDAAIIKIVNCNQLFDKGGTNDA